MRWRIEEYFKFKKQSFEFENLRVRSLKSIRNLDLLLTIAIGYIRKTLRAQIIEFSKRLFDVPNFLYYSVADGIFEILKICKSGIVNFFSLHNSGGQISFFGASDFSRLNFGET